MKKTICFDFGNTRLKYAVFENDIFDKEYILQNSSPEVVEEILNTVKPQHSVLSSVINHDPKVENILASKTKFHKLTHQSKLNFTTPISKPETIGTDRLALTAAAAFFHPNKNNLIIGLGSCITYNFINQDREFLGGAISPGMEMRFKSMNDYTAKLPVVNPEWHFPVLGYDTKTNLQSGVIAGITYEINGFIEYYSNRYANLDIVITGGNAEYFAKHLKNKLVADTIFLFKGLYAVSELNNQ